MDDLIRKQDVITALRQAKVFGHPDALTAINHIPAIDAVPVVRCGECRYSDDYYNDGSCYCKHPEREMRYIGTNWNWYCADGKRKD